MKLVEHHFCDLKISHVTDCLLVGSSAFCSQLVSLKKEWNVFRLNNSFLDISAGACAPQSKPWEYTWGKIRCWWGRHIRHFLVTESICTRPKPFYSEKISNSSDLMKGKSNHVDNANFSCLLSAIMFSCKMRMEGKRCYEEENDTTDTWCIVI